MTKHAVNPTYLGKDAMFDFPIYLPQLGAVMLVVQDKDMLAVD